MHYTTSLINVSSSCNFAIHKCRQWGKRFDVVEKVLRILQRCRLMVSGFFLNYYNGISYISEIMWSAPYDIVSTQACLNGLGEVNTYQSLWNVTFKNVQFMKKFECFLILWDKRTYHIFNSVTGLFFGFWTTCLFSMSLWFESCWCVGAAYDVLHCVIVLHYYDTHVPKL